MRSFILTALVSVVAALPLADAAESSDRILIKRAGGPLAGWSNGHGNAHSFDGRLIFVQQGIAFRLAFALHYCFFKCQ